MGNVSNSLYYKYIINGLNGILACYAFVMLYYILNFILENLLLALLFLVLHNGIVNAARFQ